MRIKTNNQELHTLEKGLLIQIDLQDYYEEDLVITFFIGGKSELTQLKQALIEDKIFYHDDGDHNLTVKRNDEQLELTVGHNESNIGTKYSAQLDDQQFNDLVGAINGIIKRK